MKRLRRHATVDKFKQQKENPVLLHVYEYPAPSNKKKNMGILLTKIRTKVKQNNLAYKQQILVVEVFVCGAACRWFCFWNFSLWSLPGRYIVVYSWESHSTLASFLFIGSHSMLTFFVLSFSGTPDECLTPLVSHPLDSLHFIDRGLGSQVNINSCSTAVSVLWCHK